MATAPLALLEMPQRMDTMTAIPNTPRRCQWLDEAAQTGITAHQRPTDGRWIATDTSGTVTGEGDNEIAAVDLVAAALDGFPTLAKWQEMKLRGQWQSVKR